MDFTWLLDGPSMSGICICTYLRNLLEEKAKNQLNYQEKLSKNAQEEKSNDAKMMSDTKSVNLSTEKNQQNEGGQKGGAEDNDSGYGDEDSRTITSEDSGTTMSSYISSSESSQNVTSEESSSDETHQDRSWVRVVFLNVRSVYGEESIDELRDIQERHKPDVLAIVETFQRKRSIRKTLKEIALGKQIFHFGQIEGRRGVATLVSPNFRARENGNMYLDIVEYQAVEIEHDEWHQPILFINLYRGPGFNRTKFQNFLIEFQKLLETFSSYHSIVITCDANIYDEREEDPNTRRFHEVLDQNNLEQHVRGPTQRTGGHTLDLVITRNVEIDDLHTEQNGVSDHVTIYFKARPKKKKLNRKKLKQNDTKKGKE